MTSLFLSGTLFILACSLVNAAPSRSDTAPAVGAAPGLDVANFTHVPAGDGGHVGGDRPSAHPHSDNVTHSGNWTHGEHGKFNFTGEHGKFNVTGDVSHVPHAAGSGAGSFQPASQNFTQVLPPSPQKNPADPVPQGAPSDGHAAPPKREEDHTSAKP